MQGPSSLLDGMAPYCRGEVGPAAPLGARETLWPLVADWGRLLAALDGLSPATFTTRNVAASLMRACACRTLDAAGVPLRASWCNGGVELFPARWNEAWLLESAWAGHRQRGVRLADGGGAVHEIRFAADAGCAGTGALEALMIDAPVPRREPVRLDPWRGLAESSAAMTARNAPHREILLAALGERLAHPLPCAALPGILERVAAEARAVTLGVAASGGGQFQSGSLLVLERDGDELRIGGAAFTFTVRLSALARVWLVAPRIGREGRPCLELFDGERRLVAWIALPRGCALARG